ncbi:MAG TPA: FAD-dependent monooxygenase, partial [Candidatus Binataceae bacterium]|nr:FAD-dependent monooxygenase [Candidatus Binataceae bacterium]
MSPTGSAFDAIIVGARVAGSAAAIALGRTGLRVLLVDKAAFPSDTLSTHIVLSGGAQVLERLGALELLERQGGVRYSRMRTVGPGFDYSVELRDSVRVLRGLCLTRLKMDATMLGAVRDLANVTVREQFLVKDLVIEDGAVIGIRGADVSGEHEFRAPLTVGADGMRSTVAKIASERIGAFARTEVPCARAYYYAYFDRVPLERFGDELLTEFAPEHGAASLACRCDGDRVVAACAFDARALHQFRTDLLPNLRRQLEATPGIARTLADASVASKVLSSGFLANTYRVPVADGAILIGDAGLHADPLFGQGHSLALMSVEILAELAPQWFAEGRARDAIPATA